MSVNVDRIEASYAVIPGKILRALDLILRFTDDASPRHDG